MTKSLKDRLKDMDSKRVQEWKADLESAENRTESEADTAANRTDQGRSSKNIQNNDLVALFDDENRNKNKDLPLNIEVDDVENRN